MMKKRLGMLHRVLIICVSLIISITLIVTATMPKRYDLLAGEISTVDIYAPRDVEDSLTTMRRRSAAAEQVLEQYKIDYEQNKVAETALSDFFTSVTIEAANEFHDLKMKIATVAADTKNKISDNSISSLLLMNSDGLGPFSQAVTTVLTALMDEGVVDAAASLEEAKKRLTQKGFAKKDLDIAGEILAAYIVVNKSIDYVVTEAERQRVRETVEPTVYKKNQVILRKGEQIKEEQIQMLKDLGLMRGSSALSVKYATGIISLLVLAYLLCGLYLLQFKHDIIYNKSKFYIANLIPVLTFAMLFFSAQSSINPYLVPISICSILIAVFIDLNFSLLVNVLISVLAATMLGGDALYVGALFLIGAFSAGVFKKATNFSAFAVTSMVVCAINSIVFIVFALIDGQGLNDIMKIGGYGIINGLISSIITIGIIPFLEISFDVITPFKLNELSSPERRILKRMLFETPGTYHHSLMVGNLAEAACIRIGANELLARVAAYYHDIGKLKRPVYFKENQIGENPHDSLMPEESARLIISHVEDGLSIARQYRLPNAIREIIARHHGTTMAGVFYNKAVLEYGEANVDKSLYQYKGPKPNTRESATVMLADSCEAAVRALDDKSEESVERVVRKIVKARIADGQLEDSNLTFKDLEEIVKAFVSMFSGYFHQRIKYDDFNEEDKV